MHKLQNLLQFIKTVTVLGQKMYFDRKNIYFFFKLETTGVELL